MTAMDERFSWWNDLLHQGMLIAPAVLMEVFPDAGVRLSQWQHDRLRDRYTAFVARSAEHDGERLAAPAVRAWLDALFMDFAGYGPGQWLKQDRLESRYHVQTPAGERLRPDRVLLRPGGEPALLVRVDEAPKLGQGRAKAEYTRLLELLRATGVKLGLLTNGRRFRLCYAGLDHDAFVEWDAESWFSGETGRQQLEGFLYLLGTDGTAPRDGLDFPLLHAVEVSRTRQGELAQVLGDQVRQAVEQLVQRLPAVLAERPDLAKALARDPVTGRELAEADRLRALYQAATRLVMRLVVVLYAEARDLFPRDNVVYYQSYSVEQLYQTLRQASQLEGRKLEERRGGWAQLLSLFRLIHAGSGHPNLSLRAYGGQLFAPGSLSSSDPVGRALVLFEAPEYDLNDLDLYHLLQKLKFGPIRVRQGRGWRTTRGPVDFSDLRTEYIGIMYQGLLDYELRQVGSDPMVVLGIGQEPVLPLPLLEGKSDAALKELLQKLVKEGSKKAAAAAEDEDDDAGDDAAEPELEGEPEAVEAAAQDGENPETADDNGAEDAELNDEEAAEAAGAEQALRQRALDWARRAVLVAGLVKRPRGRGADLLFERRVEQAAAGLVKQLLAPGDLYLVRWGGTRKGSGTFYTRPQLAVPLTHRTLQPLCYEKGSDGTLQPRTPEEILNLKIVDPAMGSGSFLVAALNYLTDALVSSLHRHGRLLPHDQGTAIRLLGGPATGRLDDELLPCPVDDPRFDEQLRSRLKRHVVERCLYGVDLNPLAVELARLSLWIETMDRELPFEFLDHKLKVGNSLVGCWLHRFEDYPALAWARDGGDRQHDGVHHPRSERSRRIREILNQQVKPELEQWVLSRSFHGLTGETARRSLGALRERFAALHDMHKHEAEREGFYYQEILGSREYQELRAAMDRWTAIWFWPVDGSVPPLTPDLFDQPTAEIEETVHNLRERHRFFHWELEFPGVFTPERAGFDAVLGNPPWDIQKPNSLEFFTQYDPIYRTYGKQEALREQKRIFRDHPEAEDRWLDYVAGFRDLSNWVANVGEPFEMALARGARGEELRSYWAKARQQRPALVGRDVPFRHQGGADLNTYKLFLEMAHHVLREGGRLGFLVPAGIYSDKGCADLRRLFMEQCRWEFLLGVQNERFVFADVAHNLRFSVVVIQRGGKTTKLESIFRVTVAAAPTAQELVSLILHPVDSAVELTPDWLRHTGGADAGIPTLRSPMDKRILEKLYAYGRPLAEVVREYGDVTFRREFDMTGDSRLFVARARLEKEGVLTPEDDVRDPRTRAKLLRAGYLPLYEGKHIHQLNSAFSGDFSHFIPVAAKRLPGWTQVVWREVARATDTRTVIASTVVAGAYGHTLWTVTGLSANLSRRLAVFLNSFVIDYFVRLSLSGAHVILASVQNIPLADIAANSLLLGHLEAMATRVLAHQLDHREVLFTRCSLDALVAAAYQLSEDEFAHILGAFPAVDKNLPEPEHQTTLTLSAYRQLLKVGVEEFCRSVWHPPQPFPERERASISRWAPKGGWEKAWSEARSLLSEGEWAMLTGEAPPVPTDEQKKAAAGRQTGGAQDTQLRLDL